MPCLWLSSESECENLVNIDNPNYDVSNPLTEQEKSSQENLIISETYANETVAEKEALTIAERDIESKILFNTESPVEQTR